MNFHDLSGWVFVREACTMPAWLIDALNRIVLEKSVHAAMRANVCRRSVSSRLIHQGVLSSQSLARLSMNGRPHSKPILLQTCRSQWQRLMRSFNCSAMSLKAFFDRPFTVIPRDCILTGAVTVLTPYLTTGGL